MTPAGPLIAFLRFGGQCVRGAMPLALLQAGCQAVAATQGGPFWSAWSFAASSSNGFSQACSAVAGVAVLLCCGSAFAHGQGRCTSIHPSTLCPART
jgi:hypothetical protein